MKTNKNITTFSVYPLSKKRKGYCYAGDRVFGVRKTKIPTEYSIEKKV